MVIGLRPYTVGGVYSMHRNATSVRRGLAGKGIPGMGAGSTGTSADVLLTMEGYPTAQSLAAVSSALSGSNIAAITIGTLIVYLAAASVVK
jgi:hypothetical protein